MAIGEQLPYGQHSKNTPSARPFPLQHVWHVQALDGPVQLAGHVDIPLRGQVTAVPHQGLQGVRRQLFCVDGRKGPAKIVEAVDVTGRRMLMFFVTWQVNASRLLNSAEFSPQGFSAMWPRKNESVKADDLLQVLDHNRVQRDKIIPFALVVAMPG